MLLRLRHTYGFPSQSKMNQRIPHTRIYQILLRYRDGATATATAMALATATAMATAMATATATAMATATATIHGYGYV